MSTVTNTQVFTITKGRFKGCKVIPLVRSIVPIYVAKGKTCYAVSQPELVRLNSQAIARGFSRTLWPSKIGKLSKDLFFPILAAFEHTSREGYRERSARYFRRTSRRRSASTPSSILPDWIGIASRRAGMK